MHRLVDRFLAKLFMYVAVIHLIMMRNIVQPVPLQPVGPRQHKLLQRACFQNNSHHDPQRHYPLISLEIYLES